MLYFSAHWCPPCRGFTPQLATYYNTYKEKFNFELVFISSDNDESAFKGYFGEMPWLALPYANRDQKNALSKKYKVQGIPTLVVLDPKAQTITTGGRGKVTAEPEGFPWIPKSFHQIITGNVVNGKGETIDTETLKGNTAIGIYFSAHWCPPCRGFTPQLVEAYKAIKNDGKKFEIIFATSDKDEASYKEYFEEMPWLSFPFGDSRISELSDLYDVEGIPMLVIVDPVTGKVINSSGRGAVGGDLKGLEFPWYPKPCNSVENAGDQLNDHACLIFLDKELHADTQSILTSVAVSYMDNWKKQGKEEYPMLFFFGKDGNLANRVRDFTNVKPNPALLILDLPNQQKFVHEAISGQPTEAQFRNFVEGFLAGTLTKMGIKE
jgi:nucleoredoxin